MNSKWICVAASAMTLAVGQNYEGSDIRTAIPIEFGQVVPDTVDPTLRPRIVYAVSLARGQRFSILVKERGAAIIRIRIFSPTLTTVVNSPILAERGYFNDTGVLEYSVPAAGTYFVSVEPSNGASEIETVVTAVGARLDVPLPAVASCLEGNVDEIQFNLQQVSLNLAEEVTIGGVKICAACTVKPTLFPAFVDFLRQAHFAGTRVQVCHAADGQIVRVKSAR